MQAGGLLLFNELLDGLVFNGFELVVRNGAFGKLGACFLQFLGTEEAAHDIVVEGRSIG